MLVLTRRKLESIRLTVRKQDIKGDSLLVEVFMLGHQGNQARIGILAPDQVTIDREEVYQRKLAEGALDGRL